MRTRRLLAVSFPIALMLAACGGSSPAPPDFPESPDGDASGASSPVDVTSGEGEPPEEATGGDGGNDGSAGTRAAEGQYGKDGYGMRGNQDEGGDELAATVDQPLGGKLSQAEIRKIVLARGELFDRCYTIGAKGGVQFVAKVEIKAYLGPSGRANKTEVLKSNAKNPEVDDCVSEAFKQIQFPRPSDGATSVITFPIEFQGAEQVN